LKTSTGAYTRSNWNLFFEHKLALGDAITRDGHRLADAVARELLGWNTLTKRIGDRRLRDLTGLHGRSLERARANLVDVGLITFVRGKRGGNGSLYGLPLDPSAKPAVARSLSPTAIDRADAVNQAARNRGLSNDRVDAGTDREVREVVRPSDEQPTSVVHCGPSGYVDADGRQWGHDGIPF
jgi:hypothetical protein